MNYLTTTTEEGIELGRESLQVYDMIPEHNYVDNSKPDYFEGEPLTNFIDGIPIGNEIATTTKSTCFHHKFLCQDPKRYQAITQIRQLILYVTRSYD